MVTNIGRLVIGVFWAKSGTWYVSGKEDEERVAWLFIGTSVKDGNKAFTIIIFPLRIILGWS